MLPECLSNETATGGNPFIGLLSNRLNAGRPMIVVELQPTGFDTAAIIRETLLAARSGAHAVSIAEHPLGRLYPDSIALSHMIQEATGVPVLAHLTAGHRNLLGLQGALLGANLLGVRTLLALTGDPAGLLDNANAAGITRVRDVRNSFELLSIIQMLNGGKDAHGRNLPIRTSLPAGVALDANVVHLDKAIERVEKKIRAGGECVSLIVSQMLFDPRRIEAMYRSTRHLSIPVFACLAPLMSSRNARFIHHHITRVPESLIDRISASERNTASNQLEGVTVCKELIDAAVESGADGIYLVAPRNSTEIILELLDHVECRVRS